MQNKGNMGVIYLRPNLINGKKYVGKTTDLKTRQNRWYCLTQDYAGAAINNARAKYGIEAFGFEILKECNDDELDYWETYYIKELNTKAPYGYNLTDGGDGINGYHHTEEWRKKVSEKLKGRKHTEETKRKISIANKGRKPSDSCIMRLIETNTGRKQSEETKRKRVEAMRGRKCSEETKKKIGAANKNKYKGIYNTKISKKVFQIDKETNDVIAEFPSTQEVQRQLGFDNRNISACCLSKKKSAYGYKWKYAS